jgi:hypothetical protein
MTRRGKVLRDTATGPGLLMVEGQQYPFTLEGVWRSETPPRPGMVVDVDMESSGQVTAVHAVPESQLAKEQAEAAMAAAKEKGAAVAAGLVAKFGIPHLVAAVLLVLGWIYFATVTVDASLFGKFEFTFWDVLGFLSAKNILDVLGAGGRKPSAGIYGFFAIVCLAGPFLSYFWKDRRAHVAGALPLLLMVIVAFSVSSRVNSAFDDGGNANAARAPRGSIYQMQAEAQQQAREEMMKAVSLGMGAYLSVLASLYFAGTGVKRFLVAKATEAPVYEKSKRAAA